MTKWGPYIDVSLTDICFEILARARSAKPTPRTNTPHECRNDNKSNTNYIPDDNIITTRGNKHKNPGGERNANYTP